MEYFIQNQSSADCKLSLVRDIKNESIELFILIKSFNLFSFRNVEKKVMTRRINL